MRKHWLSFLMFSAALAAAESPLPPIAPVPATAKFADPDYLIWCGSMVEGDDGKFHLFYSRWPNALGHRE
jgi:hypothetical protein